ncbi:hypothetical protein TIFTF001_045571 [Ficus carica]|uniref:Uncharacterized protein n=1 Tax=Ficus carica TaxID=3494 RepID=A0AA88CMA1_FICCA|nr:hypothetical protein TIFTF001_045571 [Ficus carica]
MVLSHRACNEDLSYYEQRLGLGFASVAAAYSDLWQGRLASVVEGAVVNSSLGLNSFWVWKPLVRRRTIVSFIAGQPLGYYGSWALFSLSHHFIVWLAALRAYPQRKSIPFRNYAILGDDVVIGDSMVAREYSLILQGLKVVVSAKKSLLSSLGAFEFAKKFDCWGGTVD